MTSRGEEWIDRAQVTCTNAACPRVGVARRLERRIVGDGILEVPPLLCLYCGAALPAPSVRTRPGGTA